MAILTRKTGIPRKWLLSISSACLIAIFGHSSLQAQPPIDPRVEFIEFWSDDRSIFLYHPPLLQQVLLGIVDLKGNHRSARRHINSEVLSCKKGAAALSECRMDQLNLERNKKGIARTISVPVNVSSISGHPLKTDQSQYVLTVSWQPPIVPPPVIPIEAFNDYLGIASESRYFKIKENLDHIQINPLFQDRVTIITKKRRAQNILTLYRTPPEDLRDAFIYRVDSVMMKPDGRTAHFDLYLKAVKIEINHLTFQTTKELLQ